MARVYFVPFSGTITAANGDVDLLLLLPAAGKSIRLRGFVLGQISEVGDTQEEGIRITVRRLLATITNGSGGGAVTPVLPNENTAAVGFTARGMDTTVATSSGSNTIIPEIPWVNRNTPYEARWTDPDEMPRAQNAGGLVIRWETTVADDVSVYGYAIVEED